MKKAFPTTFFFSLTCLVVLCFSSSAYAMPQDSGSSATFKERSNSPGSTGSASTRTGSDTPEAQKLYESGMSLYEAGKLDQASATLKQAIKLNPDDAQAHYGLGLVYSKTKSYLPAAESFKRAVKLKPDWPEAYFKMGMMFYVVGRKPLALEAYNNLRRLNSPLAETLNKIIGGSSSPDGMVDSVSVVNDPPAKLSTANDPPAKSAVIPVSSSVRESGIGPSIPYVPAGAAGDGGPAHSTGNGSAATPEPIAARSTKDVAKTTSDSAAAASPASPPSPPTSDQAPTTSYRIGVGDILDIRFLNSPNARSTLYTVIDGGIIDLPVAGGPVSVGGLTVEETQGRIAAELKRRAVEVNSTVSIGVRQYSSHSIIVTGLVVNTGTRYLRREAVPLYVIMAEAQPRPDAGQVTILRMGVKGRPLQLSDSSALNELVLPGDVVNVGPRPQEFYYIGGRVNYPGQKPFQAGITLLQAILAAGGGQAENTIDISREDADGRLSTTRYKLKEIKSGKAQDPKLQAGDRIEVIR